MIPPHDRDGLWMKAKAFLNRSFAAGDDGRFSEAATWAAAALELLGKVALAARNPLLIADPNGKSLLVAAGISGDLASFKSIPAKTVFHRCAQAFRPFSEVDANTIAIQRNQELHSAMSPFADVDEDAWWESYWSLVVLLTDGIGEDLDSLVGDSRVDAVASYVERNRANVAKRTSLLIEAAHERYTRAQKSLDGQREIRTLVQRRGTTFFDLEEVETCPACGRDGLLVGDEVIESDVEYDAEFKQSFETLQVEAAEFACDHCGLHLRGWEYVAEAGVTTAFEVVRDFEPTWDDYGND